MKKKDTGGSSAKGNSKRIETGITDFDALIEGGFKPKSINLLVGGPGAGKTIFALQFLMKGLQQGESCMYITFEEKKEKLYDEMAYFGWDLQGYEKKGNFFYIELNPEQVKSLIEEGGGSVDQLISKHNIIRLVVDSVTSFSLLYQDELSRKEAGLALFKLMNKWGCTVLLTSQSASQNNGVIYHSLEFEVDGLIFIYQFKIKGSRIRALEVLKMRGTAHSNKTVKLEVSTKGMLVHPTEVIEQS
ncbi:TPA: hypothetical protein HA242_04000 [Candidatus Woesearchaeota archaeon]|nr:hypothetical protein [Candidatus Woesearchaeota archaeon]HIG93166.1 hypothetical protein [Candidatus Woesearchaeota archaeon]HIH12860.1 hypothetical protein [Candidatus Woesearchaeota archaeon]